MAGSAPRKGRGQCKQKKAPLKTSLDQVEYVWTDSGEKVGYLKHFLAAVGCPDVNTDSRGPSLNDQLEVRGHQERLFQEKVPGKCGKAPWLGSKDTLRKVYDLL